MWQEEVAASAIPVVQEGIFYTLGNPAQTAAVQQYA